MLTYYLLNGKTSKHYISYLHAYKNRTKTRHPHQNKSLQPIGPKNFGLKCKPVFIGKAAPTERSQNLRAWCCIELEHRCLRTIPDALQSLDDADQVRANLQSAGLAVHFLGGSEAATLEAIETSTEACSGPTILYQPFQVDLNPDERLWLPTFEQQLPSSLGRYQRLAGKPEQELIALIDEQITRSQPTPEMDLAQLQLALVCEALDFEAVRLLQEQILSRYSIEVDLPSFLGTRLKAMERVRKWNEFLTRRQALIFYHGAAEKERLDPHWQKAQQAPNPATLRWFIAEPGLEDKRRNDPHALWDIDQVAGLVERPRSAP